MAVPVQPVLVDEAKQGTFIQKVLDDTSGTMTTLLAILGDRLGLFKDLAAHGPSTTTELANRTGIQERYAREWLGGMVTAGYLEYNPETGRFVLPPEHWEALAHESGPFFFGGVHQMQGALAQVLDQVAEAFRNGGRVKQAQYPPVFWDGLERFTAGWFENLLIQQWLPAMPDVEAKLRAGGLVADVGCGRGRALVKLAQSFPKSRCIGYDVYPPTVQQAEGNARAAGVGDRVRFEARDVAGQGLPQEFDIVCTFEVAQFVDAAAEVFAKFDLLFDGSSITLPAHELQRYPQFQRIEAPRAHLAITKEIKFHVCSAAIFIQVLRRNIKCIAQDSTTIAHQHRTARKRHKHPLVRIESYRICQRDAV